MIDKDNPPKVGMVCRIGHKYYKIVSVGNYREFRNNPYFECNCLPFASRDGVPCKNPRKQKMFYVGDNEIVTSQDIDTVIAKWQLLQNMIQQSGGI